MVVLGEHHGLHHHCMAPELQKLSGSVEHRPVAGTCSDFAALWVRSSCMPQEPDGSRLSNLSSAGFVPVFQSGAKPSKSDEDFNAKKYVGI